MYSKLLALALLFGGAVAQNPRVHNVYVENDFACSNSDVEGRLAAGGAVSLTSYAVGCQIYNSNPQTTCIQFGSVHCADHPTDEPSLVAGTSLTLNHAQVYAGSIVYGTTYSASSDSAYVLDCTVTKNPAAGGFIKTAGFPSLRALSNGYAAKAATGSTSVYYSTLTFATTAKQAVFSVTAAQLAAARSLVLDAPADATELIINVSGADVLLSNFGFSPAFANLKRSLLWNFNEAKNVTVDSAGFWGALLAPNADLHTNNGVFNGQIFVKSVQTGGTCGQFNLAYFGSYDSHPTIEGSCGDGIVDEGEDCDGTVCCNPDCTFVTLESSTTCRAAAGECDVPEVCSGRSGDCPTDAFYGVETPCGSNFGICDVQLKSHCSGRSAYCNTAPPAYIFYWDAFNVLSFDSYTVHGGDVEGRLAVRNYADLSGFTIGLETTDDDAVSYYDLVVAGNATWTDGSVNRGHGANNNGKIAVGGVFVAPDYLQARNDPNANVPYSLFDQAQAYFRTVSQKLAALPTNAVASRVYTNGLLLTCNSLSSLYHVKVDADTISGTYWYLTSGCKFDAAWVIDISGPGDIYLTGGPFNGVVERVIYNVPNGGQYIVANNGVAGNILAPDSNYLQTSGVTYGKVIVGNVTEARQNNKPNCVDFKKVTITNRVLKKVDLGDDFVYLVDIKGYAVGDQICIDGNCRKVLKGEVGDVDGDGKVDHVVFVDAPFATTAAPGTFATTTVDPNVQRAQQIPVKMVDGSSTNVNHSSASALMVSSALFAVVAMLF